MGQPAGAVGVGSIVSEWSCLPCGVQLVAPYGWGNPAGRVDTPASPALPLEGAGRRYSWELHATHESGAGGGTPTNSHHAVRVEVVQHFAGDARDDGMLGGNAVDQVEQLEALRQRPISW